MFRPLSSLRLIQPLQSYRIEDDFRRIVDNIPSGPSVVYALALRHLEYNNNRQLPQSLSNLTVMMETHNELIVRTSNEITNTIKSKLAASSSSPLKIGARYKYDFNSVYTYLSRVWRRMTSESRVERVQHHINNAKPYRSIEGIFYFNGQPCGEGSEQEFEKMKKALYEILQNNDLLTRLAELETSLEAQSNQIQNIRVMAKEIVNLIDQNLYDTRVSGCCTNRSMLKNLIRRF